MFVHVLGRTQGSITLVKLQNMPVNLNFRLKSLLALGVFALVRVLGDVSFLLSLELIGVFGLHVLLQM